MSASREKKQRQGAGLSEKALQAQQQQAARKRNTVIYTVVGVVIAVLVAALLSVNAWNNDRGVFAFFKGRTTAATVGGNKITVAELSYYYYNARMIEFQYYNYFGITPPSDSTVRDSESGQTYQDYFLETALNDARENMALANEARRNGHSEAEVKDSLNARIKSLKSTAATNGVSYSAYLKAMYGSYMSAGVFKKLYTQDLLAGLIYNEKGSDWYDGYSEDELWAYYNADDHADSLNTFEYSYLYFTPAAVEEKDEDGNARDEDTMQALKSLELAKAKTNAEAVKEALEKDPEAFEEDGAISDLAKEEYELADANFGDHVTGVGVSSAPSAIQDKLLSMEENKVDLVENGDSGYYVVVLHSNALVEDPTRDVRHILIRAETATDGDGKTVAPTDEAMAAAKAELEAILAEFESGDRTEDSFAALADKYSDDGDGTTGGLYEGSPNGAFVTEFNEWVFDPDRQVGDVSGLIEHKGDPEKSNQYWGYHLIYYVGENEPTWTFSARNALATEDLNAWLEELTANYPAALTRGADRIGG